MVFFQDNLGKPAEEMQSHYGFNEARDDAVTVASVGSYEDHLHLTANL